MDHWHASSWRDRDHPGQPNARFSHEISPSPHQQYRNGLVYRVPFGYGWGKEASRPPTYAESIPRHLDSRSLKHPGNVLQASSNPTVAALSKQVDPSISTRMHDKLDLSKYPQLKSPWQWGYARPTTGDTTIRLIAPINQETHEVERASKQWGELVACETPLVPTAELKEDAASACLPTKEAKVRAVSSYLEHAKSAYVPKHLQPNDASGDTISREWEEELRLHTDERTRFNRYAGEYDKPSGRATTRASLSKRIHDLPSSPYTDGAPNPSQDSTETRSRRVTTTSTRLFNSTEKLNASPLRLESLGKLDFSAKSDLPKHDTASHSPHAALGGVSSDNPSQEQLSEKGVQAAQEHAKDRRLATKKPRKADDEWVRLTSKVQRPDSDQEEEWEKIDGDEEWEFVGSQVALE